MLQAACFSGHGHVKNDMRADMFKRISRFPTVKCVCLRPVFHMKLFFLINQEHTVNDIKIQL